MIIINLKDLYPSDSQQQLTEKVNYNFNQLLRLGIGEPGIQGPPGPIGPQGILGPIGPSGVRGSYWYSGSYTDPSLDPAMSGSPDPKNVNDCYLAYAPSNLAMWQWQAGTPNHWVKVIDLEAIIASHVTMTSPFERPSGSPPPPNWNSIIVPLPVPSSGTWNNTLLMAVENQPNLYTGTYAGNNSVMLRRGQLALMNGSVLPLPYSLIIGELSYDYSGGSPVTANPRIQMNNTMRVSTRYKHNITPPTANPDYAFSLFDMYTPDDGLQTDDVTTGIGFWTRHVNGAQRGSLSASFAGRRAWTGYGLSLGDITLPSVELGGLLLSNYSTIYSAIALGTNMNFTHPSPSVPYAYLLTNNNVDRIYVNQHWVPFRYTSMGKVINLGISQSAATHWDNIYLKKTLGYVYGSNFQFWRNSDQTGFDMDPRNSTMALTKEGKVAVGRSLANYIGAGNIYGLGWGLSPVAYGNNNNRAVVHIYDDVVDMPSMVGLYEAGLLVEKRWGYLDKHPSYTGNKSGLFIHNTVNITPSSIGLPSAFGAPNAVAARIFQGQTSTDLMRGIVSDLQGLNIYVYASANAAHIEMMKGLQVGVDLQLSGGSTTTTRVSQYKAVNVYVMPKNGSTEYVTDLEDGMPMKFGFKQEGATNALNRFDGHLQFGGSGSDYELPFYGPFPGHAIHVRGMNGAAGGNLFMSPAMATSGAAGFLGLTGGYGNGCNGGDVYLYGGPSDGIAGSKTGSIYVMGGLGVGSNLTGGDLFINGSSVLGVSNTAGSVYIGPSVTTNLYGTILSAGTIAIGYRKTGPAAAAVNVGNVGFGTKMAQEKVHVMGNMAFGANPGSGVRKIYVRPGASSDDMDLEGDGAGAALALAGGDGKKTSGLGGYQGGNVYIYGGNHAGTFSVPPPLSTRQGSVVLGYTETGSQRGRIGMRKVPTSTLGPFFRAVDIDMEGNTNIHGDITWCPSGEVPQIAGWSVLEDFDGTLGYYDADVKIYLGIASPTEIDYVDLEHSKIYIRYKRMGSIAVINYYLNLDTVAGISGSSYFFLAWDPTDTSRFPNLGRFAQERDPIGGYTLYNRPPKASYATGSYYFVGAPAVAECNAAYSVGAAHGSIPAGRNVIYINTGIETGVTRRISGQIVCEMMP